MSINNAKTRVDTPQKGAWYTQVNTPGFIPERKAPDRVVLRTISAEEYHELAPILNGTRTHEAPTRGK